MFKNINNEGKSKFDKYLVCMYNIVIISMDFTEKILGQTRQAGEVKENYIPCIIYSKEIKETILFFLDKISISI